ncbi:hypothetical protein GGI15_003327 [Coemansia interrupta]|uniref:Uncharacterized protein n=1 Tax=Coemansia interrupta TaxID=1126814 RepID=A0A9W8H9W0_9FUNG|nr:hypothetical protein GGI15_003327 [Coemansia interrupta]
MYHSSTETGLRSVVNVWDPRYIKGKAPTELRIPDNTKPVNSVNFARSAPGSDPVTFIARRGKVAFTDLAFDMQAN